MLSITDEKELPIEQVNRDPRIVPLAKVFSMESEPQRFLLENLIPAGSLTMLCGPSDCGKTIMARQIAIEIAKGNSTVFGSSLHYETQKVIYVSTEDSFKDWKYKMDCYPFSEDDKKTCGENLLIINDFDDLHKILQTEFKIEPACLVVMDVFGDMITGDLNSAPNVRSFFKPFKALANKYGTAFLFIHHLSKRGESRDRADKQNVLGSMAIESSMRSVIELRKENSEEENRVLKITKGNYVSDKIKKTPINLKLQENFTYLRAESVEVNRFISAKNDSLKLRVYELHDMGYSYREIADIIAQEDLPHIKKTKISEIIKNRPLEELGIIINPELSEPCDDPDYSDLKSDTDSDDKINRSDLEEDNCEEVE